MSEDDGSRRYLIGRAAAACAVCCAPPLMALLGIAVTGAAATVASLLSLAWSSRSWLRR